MCIFNPIFQHFWQDSRFCFGCLHSGVTEELCHLRNPDDPSVSVKVHVMPAFVPNVVSFMTKSIPRQKRKGDNMHPYLTSVFISKYSVRYWPQMTLDLKSFYSSLITLTTLGDSIMPENTPERVYVNDIQSFFEINEVCINWSVPFLVLFLICRNVKIWFPQDIPFRKPACSLRISGSKAAEILSRITLLKPLLVTDSRVIPLRLLHILRSPFFGNLIISPVFQSVIICSFSHIPSKSSIKVLTIISPPAFNISALTLSAPGAFLDFMELTAFLTSTADGGSIMISRSSSLTGISARLFGASLLRMVSKCDFYMLVCSAMPVITLPFKSFTGTSLFLKPPTRVFVYIVQCNNILSFCSGFCFICLELILDLLLCIFCWCKTGNHSPSADKLSLILNACYKESKKVYSVICSVHQLMVIITNVIT